MGLIEISKNERHGITHNTYYTNIDQTLVNSLHGLLNCEIGGLDCHVITTEYRTCVYCIHMYHLFCNALVRVIYSGYLVNMLIQYLFKIIVNYLKLFNVIPDLLYIVDVRVWFHCIKKF